MKDRQAESFPERILHRMSEAGLEGAELVSAEPECAAFGDTSATFRAERLLLRFVRDRGEEFLDVGSTDHPDTLFQYDDVQIAMGWRSVDEILDRNEPEPIEHVLDGLARKIPALQAAFSPELVSETMTRIRSAEAMRGEAFAARLRQR